MERIGVRELRQNASRYLARVARGESLEITEHGRPVARLVPITVSSWDDLVASGRVVPATLEGDVADLETLDFGVAASAELLALREDER
jgi:prevent-host-death family protein